MSKTKALFVNDFFARFPDLSLQPQDQLAASDFSLENMQALGAALGHPEQDCPSLHIAGTNGKGSVSAFCSTALEAQGYKVGRYTSPHLVGPLEGIRVNGQKISLEQAQALIEGMKSKLEALSALTRFELVTALAFLYFSESNVDVAVIEVGLGGRLDATNVISPMVSIITPIDLEHQAILGDSHERIAVHKAGIIKEGIPVVIAPQVDGARQVLLDAAEDKGARVIEVGADVLFERRVYDFDGQSLRIWQANEDQSVVDLKIRLHGKHQVQNAATAYASLLVANEQGLTINAEAIRDGFARAQWPGRFEIVQTNPPVVLDAAHTPAAAQRLAQALDDYFPAMRVLALFAISGDKNLEELLAPLKDRLSQVVATQSGHARARDAAELAEAVRDYGVEAISIANPEDAYRQAKDMLGGDSLLVVFGSVFLVERLREFAMRNSETT